MKYISILLFTIIVVISAEIKVPDYIHTCKRNDPEISKCIQNSILSLRDILRKGIPELGVVTIEPLIMNKLVLDLGPGISAVGTNLQLTGAKNYQIENLVADINADTYSFDLTIPGAQARGNYELEAKLIASIPLKGKGPITLTAKSVTGKGKLHGKKVIQNGKTRYYFSSMDLKLQVIDCEMRLGNLFEGAPEIGEVINKVLNEDKDEVLASVIPAIEKSMIQQILTTANNLIKPYTWEELLPKS